MKSLPASLFIFFSLFITPVVFAQNENASGQAKEKKKPKSLFENTDPLPITVMGNIRELLGDRDEQSPNHKMDFIYEDEPGVMDTVKVMMKTRGHFRKSSENCTYPPLLVTFDSTLQSATFGKNDKLKLVMPCTDDYFVTREYLVYKIYNLLTPFSLKARLVKLTMKDTKKGKTYNEMFGVLLENEKKMAKRNNETIIKRQLPPERLQQETYLRMAMFQYLIGNTDWSIQFQQNIILMASQANPEPICVAYDFDHSGMVDAPYAQPAEALQMKNVQERRYRGYCIPDLTVYDPIIKQFNDAKKDIYALYTDFKFIDDKYRSTALKYFDEFYETINNPEAFKKDFLYPCDKNGTGNVIIKGLQKD